MAKKNTLIRFCSMIKECNTQHYQYNNHFLLFHPFTSVTIQENTADSQQNAQGG